MNPAPTGLYTPEFYKLVNSASAKAEGQAYFFGELDRVVAPLLELLGDETLLVPEVYGEKRPRLRGWNRLTSASLDDYYFKMLEESVLAGGEFRRAVRRAERKPLYRGSRSRGGDHAFPREKSPAAGNALLDRLRRRGPRSEEHTSERV